MFEYWIDRITSKGSNITYDEIWHSYFSSHAGFDYIYPMCIVDKTNEIIELIDISVSSYDNTEGRNVPLFMTWPTISNLSNINNNIIGAGLWFNSTSGVIDLSIDKSKLPAYLSVFICLRDVDTSFTIRTPEQILAHYVVWISDDSHSAEIHEIKKTEGCAILIYKHQNTINLNISIHQGSFIGKYLSKIIEKLFNSIRVPETIIEEIIFRYYIDWLKISKSNNRHNFINPFYVAITEHYFSDHTTAGINVTNVSNNNIFQRHGTDRTMMVDLSVDFIENRLIAFSPALMRLGLGWPGKDAQALESLILYHLYNKPYSVRYTSNYDRSSESTREAIIRSISRPVNENNMSETTFDIYNINIPDENYISHKTIIESYTSPEGSIRYYDEVIIDNGFSYKRLIVPYIQLNSNIGLYDYTLRNDGSNTIQTEYYITYSYNIHVLSNNKSIPVSLFTFIVADHNLSTGESNINTSEAAPNRFGAITGFQFYTGYPVLVIARKTQNHKDLSFKFNITKSLLSYYPNVLYPVMNVEIANNQQQNI